LSKTASRLGWFFYFIATAVFPALVGLSLFEELSPAFLTSTAAAILMLTTWLAFVASQQTRKRGAWVSGVAAISALLAARIIAFDAYCWQHALTFCKAIEPPILDWPGRVLQADGHFGEDLAIFQMWLFYFLLISAALMLLVYLIARQRNAHLQNRAPRRMGSGGRPV
jgi:hypothetical protein